MAVAAHRRRAFVDKRREAKAAVVAFDIDFAGPDRTSPQLLLPLLARNGVRHEEAERLLAAVPNQQLAGWAASRL